MEERTKLASMLRDFQAEQKELLVQAEKRLEVNVAFFFVTFFSYFSNESVVESFR